MCGVNFLESCLKSHLENVHGVFQADVIDEEYLESCPGRVFGAPQSVDSKIQYPIPGYVSEATNKWGLYFDFYNRQHLSLVLLLSEGGYPKCNNCGMKTKPSQNGWGYKQTGLY